MRVCVLRAAWPLLLFALAACSNLTVPFDETAFAPIRSSGSAAITGRAAGYMGDRHWAPMETRVAHHLPVGLMPANAYTDDVARTIWQHAPASVGLDPRLTQFVRKTSTDGDGNFSFGHVAPGTYYVFCRFTWPSRDRVLDTFNDYVTRDYLNEQTVFAKVTVTGGETVRVGTWQLSAYTGSPVDNPPSLQQTRIIGSAGGGGSGAPRSGAGSLVGRGTSDDDLIASAGKTNDSRAHTAIEAYGQPTIAPTAPG